MKTKYYIAFPKRGNVFNCVSGEYDISVTVYEARIQIFDTQMAAEKFRKENIDEDIKGIGESFFELSKIFSVQEDLDTNGNGLGSYKLPRFSATMQFVYESFSF